MTSFVLMGMICFYIAYKSGQHHATRAKRIVEKNRLERKQKWRQQERIIKQQGKEIRELKTILTKRY